jgi:hypothetical protein
LAVEAEMLRKRMLSLVLQIQSTTLVVWVLSKQGHKANIGGNFFQ